VYSPDGQRIAFSSNRGGAREQWVANANGDDAQPVTSFNGPIVGTPRWSPDGRQLVFDARPDGNSDIFIVAAGGGQMRRLTERPGDDARPAWSADGRSIYFSSDRGGGNEIWRMPADGGDAVQITRHGGSAALVSADGQHLYYRRTNAGAIFQIRTDGTGDAEIVPAPAYATLTYAVTRSGLAEAGEPKFRQLEPAGRVAAADRRAPTGVVRPRVLQQQEVDITPEVSKQREDVV
jgi:Tol biopolymer transport system component